MLNKQITSFLNAASGDELNLSAGSFFIAQELQEYKTKYKELIDKGRRENKKTKQKTDKRYLAFS